VAVAVAVAVVLLGLPGATGALASTDPVRAAVARADLAGALTPEQVAEYGATYAAAQRRETALDGLPKRELRAVLRITRDIARRGSLSPSRMPAVFLTLRRNTEWWSEHGPPAPLSPGEKGARGRLCKPFPRARARAARLSFPGSRIVFEYYPGLGLQIQVLATFANAQAQLNIQDATADALALQTIDEMVPLVSDRGGLTAWEYLFPFQGGRPPWTSTISQATAVRALATAGLRLGRPDLVALAQRAVATLATPAPLGVRVPLAKDGNWYVLYSFAPGLRVLNAHLQTLNALYDLNQLTGDERAGRLYREGLRAARRRIGNYDTGRWSKYANPGAEADLNYHVLNRDLARGVCRRSGEPAICGAADRYTQYLERRCPKVVTARHLRTRTSGHAY